MAGAGKLKALAGGGLEKLRLHLSRPDVRVLLALLGILAGLLSGAVIIVFRWIVESAQMAILPGGQADNYEGLPVAVRMLLPVGGGLLIGLVFSLGAAGQFVVGVPKLMERLAYHQGYIGLRAALMQFVGASIALISGHSVGREGPSIFLGGACGSLLGQYLALPHNSIRTMVGCGTAAAIGASFNTPLAGVIFALEVVLMEYTLASFTPVILAAVSATAMAIAVYGTAPAFSVPQLQLGSLGELPLVLLLGFLGGSASALLIYLVDAVARRSQKVAFWQRCALAGAIVGGIGALTPAVMGIGYDTVNAALLGQLGLGLCLAIVALKLAATAACIGLGTPAGIIGPTLVIGAALGGTVGILASQLFPEGGSNSGVYALLGMGAMMGATLQAPLAALTAVMELTQNPQIILPGMLAIVTADITLSELYGRRSVFVTLLQAKGMDYSSHPMMLALRRVGVAAVMERRFAQKARHLERPIAEEVMRARPEWLLIDDKGSRTLMRALDLARYLQEAAGEASIDLLSIPAKRLDVAPIHLQATLQEALDRLNQSGAEALYVERTIAPMIKRVYGVLTREQIESSYRY